LKEEEEEEEEEEYFFWAASAALARASSEANLSSSLVIRLLPPSKQPKHKPMVSCLSPPPLSYPIPFFFLSFSPFLFLPPLPYTPLQSLFLYFSFLHHH